MVEIHSDNNVLERAILEMCDLIKANGGKVDDRLTIEAVDGNIRVLAAPDIPTRTDLMRCPTETLIPLDKFVFGVEGNDLVLKEVKDGALESQKKFIEPLLTVYNEAGKIADTEANRTSKLAQFDEDLFKRILPNVKMERYQGKDREELLADAFLHTRQLGYREISNEKDGSNTDGGDSGTAPGTDKKNTTPVLMPVIDLVNHNIAAPNFFNQNGIEIRKSPSGLFGSEVFVRYGPYDALDMLNSYNYVDPHQRFVVVRPTELELEGLGTLRIEMSARRFNGKKIPPQIKDLRSFLPPIRKMEDGGGIAAGFLRIPTSQSPRALRRILTFLIGMMNQDRRMSQTDHLIDHAERHMLTSTREFYQSLRADLVNYKPAPEIEGVISRLNQVAKLQLELLDQYSFERARGSLQAGGMQ